MKRNHWATLLAIVLAVGVTGCAETTEPKPPEPHGSIDVHSSPDSASVWLDGRDTGQVTDCLLDNVSYGQHVVTLKLREYATWSDTVEVEREDYPYYLLTLLDWATASLQINSQPPGAQIRLSYHDLGLTTPALIDSLIYRHQDIQLNLAGYYPSFGKVVLVGEETTVYNATLEPAPDKIVCYMKDDSLFTLSLDGMRRQLWASDLRAHNIVWSPNGLYLAYASTAGVTILNSDGSLRATLGFSGGARANDFVWSHAGDKLVVGAYVDGIYVYDANTNETTRVLRTSGYTYDHNPTFSPGDSLIAYVHHEWETHAWICIMRADGSGAHSVSQQMGTGYDSNLYLSWVLPDVILWASGSGLHRFMPSTGTSDTVIPATDLWNLTVSPDYTRFAFAGDDFHLGTVADWQSRVVDGMASNVTWEPDGSSLTGQLYDWMGWMTWEGTPHQIELGY